MPDQNLPPTIEEFREKITEDYLSKGIVPPKPSSPEEQQLYNLFLKGWQKIHLSDDGR